MSLELGEKAPDFSLPDTTGNAVSVSDFADISLLVMFICNHCPYVKHVAPELARIGQDYADKPIQIIAVQSNDVAGYPDDSPEKMVEEAANRGYVFPYVYDATQEVAKAYSAACTPDFFLFNADHKLAYRGQLDETRPVRVRSGVYDSTNAAHGATLRTAIDQVLAGDTPPPEQVPSLGCSIKWVEGNEPDYFVLDA